MADIDLSGLSVALMMGHRDWKDTTVRTQNSVIKTITALSAYGIRFEYFSRTGGDLNLCRNALTEIFLASEHNRAFLFDSDLGWEPEGVLRILWHSLRHEVIGACYVAKSDRKKWISYIDPKGAEPDKHGCVPVIAMGLGFTCVQRTVFEQLSAKAPRYRHVQHDDPLPEVFRFDKIVLPGQTVPDFCGEDAAFFSDVRDLGYVPMLDPSIELGHIGLKEFKGRYSEVLVKAEPAAADAA